MLAYVPKYEDDCGPKTREINLELLTSRVPSKGRIADLGSGKGELSRQMKAQGFEIVAVELEEPQPEDYPGIEVHQANLDDGIPLPDSSCDGLIAQEVVHLLENPWAFFREMSRILKPGGIAVVSIPNLDHLFVNAYQTLFQKMPFFFDWQYEHAHSVSPIHRWNIERMGRQAGLNLEHHGYNINYIPVLRLELKVPTFSRLGHTLITLWRK